jgi:hypothetical protein
VRSRVKCRGRRGRQFSSLDQNHLDYATSIGAIIVALDYRLLPEVSVKEILEDIDDSWHWLHSPQFVEVIKYASDSHITPDNLIGSSWRGKA